MTTNEDILVLANKLLKASNILDRLSYKDNFSCLDISKLTDKANNLCLIAEILHDTISHFDRAESTLAEMESHPDYRTLFDLKWETRELSRKGKISIDGTHWRQFENRIEELIDRCPVKKRTRVKRKQKKYASRDELRKRMSAKGMSEKEIEEILAVR